MSHAVSRRRPRNRLLLELDLTRGLAEAPAAMSQALVARRTPMLGSVVEALDRARDDRWVVGLVAHIGQRELSLAHAEELRAAVRRLAEAGKATVCWTETFGESGPGTVAYYVASGFDEIWLQPSGDLQLTGIVARAVFVSRAFEHLGVEPQIRQRYEYKSAADTFLRTEMSDAGREMARRLAESATETIVAGVAGARGLDPSRVREAIDAAPLSAPEALERGLVDRLGYRDEAYSTLRGRLGPVALRYVHRYPPPLHRLEATAEALVRRKGTVAVVQAVGAIHLGASVTRPFGPRSAGSDTIGAALGAAGRDESIRAVVLRVHSPGGSYAASDAIRREVLALRASGRPVVASMGPLAASGGYFVAMGCEAIVANAGTLTGSIGVLGGKQVIRQGLARLGIDLDSEAVGRHAEFLSTARPFTDDEWQRLEAWLDRVYEDFTAKVAEDRGLPIERVREVARGRVWTGADARERGLVDELGGLAEAVALACSRAGLARDEARVTFLPRRTLVDRLRPPRSSEQAVAPGGGFEQSLGAALAAFGLPPAAGVLSVPIGWRLS
jgi:protease-4